jgi:nitronate monooxygenase
MKGQPMPMMLRQLRIPLIAAPMLRVSGPELVLAACRSGVVGAFPTLNCRTLEELETWIQTISAGIARSEDEGVHCAPWAANLIMRRDPNALSQEIKVLVRHKTRIVITSVGSPESIVPALHEAGCMVLSDVVSIRHAEKAIEAGVDGLVLLTAGAGGKTGWANPFAFVRAVRRHYDGILVLAGGLSDGASLRAAITLGCDLGYMGTQFIATTESLASSDYKQMLVASTMDDVILTSAITGTDSSFLKPSLQRLGMSLDALPEDISEARAREMFGADSGGPKRWSDIWSAGHSVSGVLDICPTSVIVDRITREFADA